MIRIYFSLLLLMSACQGGPAASGAQTAETTSALVLSPGQCTLYQTAAFAQNPAAYTSCADVTVPYDNISPENTVGFMWSRTVPRCLDGTDGPCSGEEIRCIDGTRPYYHVDKAVQPSNKWLFFFPGGGSCGSAAGCLNEYNTPSEAREMSTRHADPNELAVPNRISVGGILNENVSTFSGFNRVEIYKCSYDRYAGNRTFEDLQGKITLFFHGRRIIEAVLNDLNRSRGVVWEDSDGSLPKLANATQVLAVGNSGGSGGLIQNADWMRAKLAAITQATVRFVLDARITPSGAAESHFEPSPGGAALHDSDYSGDSDLTNNTGTVTITRSNATYDISGATRMLFEAWGKPTVPGPEAIMDESCFASHPIDPWLCFDEQHVLYHHLSVDRFLYQTLRDVNHRNNPQPWVDRVNGAPAVFAFVPDGSPTDQYLRAFEERVIYTTDQIFHERAHSDEPIAPVYDLAIMVPDNSRHVSVIDDHSFNDAFMTCGMTKYSFASALRTWLANPGDMLLVDDLSTTEKIVGPGGGCSTTP